MEMSARPKALFRTSAILALLSWSAAGVPASAQQAIERNIPEAVEPRQGTITVPEQQVTEADDTPLGIDLAGIRLLGPIEEALANPPKGVSVGELDGASAASLTRVLAPFVGQPVTRRLIGNIQAAVTRLYREDGYPFVSVTVPPQEITGGVLQFRVIEFKAGDIKVSGTQSYGESFVRRGVRTTRGDRIDARQLSEDLEWLNRTAYRRVQGEFSPGDEQGTSTLGLRVAEGKPWQVTAGWSNTGTQESGRDRAFVGAGLWLGWLNNTTLTYQLTANEDVWRKPERVQLEYGDRPRYLSHAGRIVVPTFARQALEIAPSFVSMSQQADEFISFDNTVFELPVIYRSALSNVLPGIYFGDIYAGAEFKMLFRTTSFVGTEVARGKAELFNLVFGWSHTMTDRFGRTTIDARAKVNPGGVLDKNDNEVWNLYSGGRLKDIRYAYAAADVSRVTLLPYKLAWVSQLSGVVAGEPLPDTERMSLGGFYAVRGYGLDDASIDTGFVWRNEFRLPPIQALGRLHKSLTDGAAPFIFADLGYGHDFFQERSLTLASIGAGLDYSVSDKVSANIALGYVLRDADRSRVGDWNVQARVSFTY
jgi:hemolysin activation/secretion protein